MSGLRTSLDNVNSFNLPSSTVNLEKGDNVAKIRSSTGETRQVSLQKTNGSPNIDVHQEVQGKSLGDRQVKAVQGQGAAVPSQDQIIEKVRGLMAKAEPLLDKMVEGEWFKTGASTSWRVALVRPENRAAAEQALCDVFQDLAASTKDLTEEDFQKAFEPFFAKLSEGNLLDTWSIEPESAVVTYQGVEYSAETVTDLRRAMCQTMFAENACRLMSPGSLTDQIGTLRQIANYAVSKDAAATGGNGYIGLGPNGAPVKFLTHYGERSAFKNGRMNVTAEDSNFATRATENLRDTLLGIAGGVSSAMRAKVDALLTPEEKNGMKLLSREQVVRAIDEIAKEFKAERGERFSWKNVQHLGTEADTTFSGVLARQTARETVKEPQAPKELKAPQADKSAAPLDKKGVQPQGTVNGATATDVSAPRDAREARDLYFAKWLRDELNGEGSRLSSFFANNPRGLGAQGPTFKKAFLEMLDCKKYLMDIENGGYVEGTAALHEILRELLPANDKQVKATWSRVPSANEGDVESPTTKQIKKAFEDGILEVVKKIARTLTLDDVHVPGVYMGHGEHPIPGQVAPNLKKGQVFRQGHNTCFMMSVFNSLNSRDDGFEFLKSRLFNEEGVRIIRKSKSGKETVEKHPVNVNKDTTRFSQLEQVLFDLYKPIGEGLDGEGIALGKIGTSIALANALGLLENQDSEEFSDEMTYFQRRMRFAKAVEAFKANPCNVFFSGGHYTAVTGVYSDDKDFGFWISDSLSNKDYKVSLKNTDRAACKFFSFGNR